MVINVNRHLVPVPVSVQLKHMLMIIKMLQRTIARMAGFSLKNAVDGVDSDSRSRQHSPLIISLCLELSCCRTSDCIFPTV